jgi:hypothetical protein
VVLRKAITTPLELAEELARQLGKPTPKLSEKESTYRHEARAFGLFVRKHLRGSTLLLDEADEFLSADQRQGGACSEELRALAQERVCAIVLAGYRTLYRAVLSQSHAAYNLGQTMFLGPLERNDALRLATEPMERIGIRWADAQLPEYLVDTLGFVAHLIQESGRRLLLRLRGFREFVLDAEDVSEVLGSWRPTNEPNSLRDELIKNVETNLRGPAQAVVWLLSSRREGLFTRAEMSSALRDRGFVGLSLDQLNEICQVLEISGVCRRDGDRFHFTIPLLQQTVAELDTAYLVDGLVEEWRATQAKSFNFWGGDD